MFGKKFLITGFLTALFLFPVFAQEKKETGDKIVFVTVEGRNYGDDVFKRQKTRVAKPEGFVSGNPEMVPFGDENFDCTMYAKSFAQGNAVYAEFVRKPGLHAEEEASFMFNGSKVPLTETSWGYRCFAAIHPEKKPGRVKALFAYKSGGSVKKIRVVVTVKDVKYPVSKKRLDLGKFSDESYYKDPAKKKFIIKG